MWDYLHALHGASSGMHLGTYGKTWEGRELPYAVLSRPLVSEPWEAWAVGRPIVLLAANVHGGERTFREGLLVLTRDFLTPGTEAYELLDDVTVIVAPQINPDGFESSLDGQRGNLWGIDLNRDYVKLEQPEIASYVANVVSRWRPHVFVDGHNGGSAPYDLNYQCPSHAAADPELTLICDNKIFPAINARLAREDFSAWYYQTGNEQAWTTGGFEARIGRNYGGFINSIGILFEAPGQTMEEGARAGYLAYLTVVKFAAENAAEIKGIVERARSETIAMGAAPRGDIPVRMEYAAEDYPASYLLLRPRGGAANGGRGGPMDTIRITNAKLMKKPVATLLRPRPWAYLLPRDAVAAVDMLRRHDITVEVLTAEAELEVSAYTVAGVTHEPAYNHAAATKVQVGEVITLREELPPGTFVVRTAQSLGRLVTHMLEPESDDNVVYWNTMDAWIPIPGQMTGGPEGGREGPAVVPIYKLMRPSALPTRLIEDGR
jgi:hypothetical protein